MPRLKKADPPFIGVRRLLLGYDLNSVRMADALDVSRPTGKRKLDHPEELTLAELRKLHHHAGIPADEIREAIKF